MIEIEEKNEIERKNLINIPKTERKTGHSKTFRADNRKERTL